MSPYYALYRVSIFLKYPFYLNQSLLLALLLGTDELSKGYALVTVNNWIDFEDIEINSEKVCRYLGYIAEYKLTARISSLIKGYIENVHNLIEPSYSYVIREIEGVRRSCAFIGDSIVFESEVIARLLEPCSEVALFVGTIGHRLEEMAHKLAVDGCILQSAVLDALGSVAVDEVAEYVAERIDDIAKRHGLETSRRFSPGYCDWTIRQQKELFRVVDATLAGVSLTEGFLMIPQKSISGIIGIGSPDSNVNDYNPCRTCKKRDCLGRR